MCPLSWWGGMVVAVVTASGGFCPPLRVCQHCGVGGCPQNCGLWGTGGTCRDAALCPQRCASALGHCPVLCLLYHVPVPIPMSPSPSLCSVPSLCPVPIPVPCPLSHPCLLSPSLCQVLCLIPSPCPLCPRPATTPSHPSVMSLVPSICHFLSPRPAIILSRPSAISCVPIPLSCPLSPSLCHVPMPCQHPKIPSLSCASSLCPCPVLSPRVPMPCQLQSPCPCAVPCVPVLCHILLSSILVPCHCPHAVSPVPMPDPTPLLCHSPVPESLVPLLCQCPHAVFTPYPPSPHLKPSSSGLCHVPCSHTQDPHPWPCHCPSAVSLVPTLGRATVPVPPPCRTSPMSPCLCPHPGPRGCPINGSFLQGPGVAGGRGGGAGSLQRPLFGRRRGDKGIFVCHGAGGLQGGPVGVGGSRGSQYGVPMSPQSCEWDLAGVWVQ